MKPRFNKGFSLLEVLIGLVISGIMAASLVKVTSMTTLTIENLEKKETLQRTYFTILGDIRSRGFAPLPLPSSEQDPNPNSIYAKGFLPYSIDSQINGKSVLYQVDTSLLSTAESNLYYDPGNLIKNKIANPAKLNSLNICIHLLERSKASGKFANPNYVVKLSLIDTQNSDILTDLLLGPGDLMVALGCTNRMSLIAANSKAILALADNLKFADINIKQKKMHQDRLNAQESILNSILDIFALAILANNQDLAQYAAMTIGAGFQLFEIVMNLDHRSLPIVSLMLTSVSTLIITLNTIRGHNDIAKKYYLELINNNANKIIKSLLDSALADAYKQLTIDKYSAAVVEFENNYSEGILR